MMESISVAWCSFCGDVLYSFLHIRLEYFRNPRHEAEHAKKGFSYCALKTWDDIPANIIEIQNPQALQKGTKSSLNERRILKTNTLKHKHLEEEPIFYRSC